MRRRRLVTAARRGGSRELIQHVARVASPLVGPADLDPLLERIGDARYVLLGEASHGTSEYYQWRARISQRLIREKGVSFIAVEGDWPDCYRVNRYVKGLPDSGADAREVLDAFVRWPTWMWANEEVVDLAEWLRRHNTGLAEDRKVGFYGLDVYSLWDSLYAVLGYLRKADPAALPAARRAFLCFEPYGEDVEQYARATALVPTSCEDEVVVRRGPVAFVGDAEEVAHLLFHLDAALLHDQVLAQDHHPVGLLAGPGAVGELGHFLAEQPDARVAPLAHHLLLDRQGPGALLGLDLVGRRPPQALPGREWIAISIIRRGKLGPA
jgi:hypothetical protein